MTTAADPHSRFATVKLPIVLAPFGALAVFLSASARNVESGFVPGAVNPGADVAARDIEA